MMLYNYIVYNATIYCDYYCYLIISCGRFEKTKKKGIQFNEREESINVQRASS